MDISQALATLGTAATVLKKAGELPLQKQLIEAEEAFRDVTREKRRLEDKIEELERKLKVKAELTFKAPYYWHEGDTTPFCPACFEGSEHRAAHLTKGAEGFFCCAICKTTYYHEDQDNGPAFAIIPMGRG